MGRRAVGHNSGLEAAQSLGFIVGSCICVILLLAFTARALHRGADARPCRPGGRINPNQASVASLARLPGIGLTRARAIVALRDELRTRDERTPAFRRAEDLARVKGIGPATIEAIRPWLQFDPPPGDSGDLAAD